MNQHEDERALPKSKSTMSNLLATIINIFKNRLEEQYKLSGPAIELVLKLSQEFVYKLADEANNICGTQGKKTISNTHVLEALKVTTIRCIIIGIRHW